MKALRILALVDRRKSNRLSWDKSFRPPFSKGGAVEDAESSSPSADGEIPIRRFLFVALRSKVCFSLCAYMVKEKAFKEFVLFRGDVFFLSVYTPCVCRKGE